MGTSNFAQGNTNCIYTIEGDYEGVWDDTRDNIAYELEALEKKKGKELDFSWIIDDEYWVEGRYERNYSATSIGRLRSDVSAGDGWIEVQVTLKTVSGYYKGFSLDFEYSLVYDCNEYGCVEDFIGNIRKYPEDFGYESISDEELQELEDVLQNKLDTLIQLTEDTFKMYSTPLGVSAKFGNGETWYSPCESI